MPELWLPVDFAFVFQASTLVSENAEDVACIGSTFTLLRQLDELCAQTAANLPKAPRDQPPDPRMEARPGLLRRLFGRRRPASQPAEASSSEPGLGEAAAYAIAIFRRLAAEACEHHVPVLLSY
jgi:hypothetical protein